MEVLLNLDIRSGFKLLLLAAQLKGQKHQVISMGLKPPTFFQTFENI